MQSSELCVNLCTPRTTLRVALMLGAGDTCIIRGTPKMQALARAVQQPAPDS
jgi:hypothetical protein